MLISFFDRVENIVGKGENAGDQHFLLFPQCFQKASFSRSLKVGLCGKELIKDNSLFLFQNSIRSTKIMTDALTVLAWAFAWSTMYFLLCLWNPKRSFEWHIRTVTITHALLVSILGIYSVFVLGPWPFDSSGKKGHHIHRTSSDRAIAHDNKNSGFTLHSIAN